MANNIFGPGASKPKSLKVGFIQAQGSAFVQMDGPHSQLIRDYNLKLIERYGYLTRRELRKKDIIDLRPILDTKNTPDWMAPHIKQTHEDNMYCIDEYYYAFIPCFEEGAYYVNSQRYIYWKIVDLDLTKHRMLLWLQDYVFYTEGCGWQPGVCGIVGWQFADPETEQQNALAEHRRMKCEFGHGDNPGDVPTYGVMYRLLDPVKDMGWNKSQIKDWNNLVISYADSTEKAMLARTKYDNLNSLAHMFTTYTIKTNRILSEHRKAAKASKQVSDSEHREYLAEKEKVKAEQGPDAAKKVKERRIRTIGEIVITSRVTPKPGRRALANYKLASWKARGHIRTLKSGKRIYIKASTRYRKALKDKIGVQPAPLTPMTVIIKDVETAAGGGYEKKLAEQAANKISPVPPE